MIVRLLELLVRILLETAVAFLAVALVLALVAYRAGRRVVVSSPDRLERISGPAAMLLKTAAAIRNPTPSSSSSDREEER